MALHNKDDEHHLEAKSFSRDIASGRLKVAKLYCSDYVLDESITTCYARTGSRKLAIELGRAVLESKSIVMLEVSHSAFQESWRLFKEKFLNIRLSFTDCTTYILTQNNSVSSVFTFDKDFDDLGLSRVP